MKRFIRSRRRRVGALLDISMTPLIDTALTLLIIFMITTPIIQNAIRVALPKGEVREDEGGNRDLVVYVNKEKQLFFNGQIYGRDELVALIKQRVDTQKGESVTQKMERICVKADQDVSYGQVIELVDRLKAVSGVSHVILATQRST